MKKKKLRNTDKNYKCHAKALNIHIKISNLKHKLKFG